MRTRICVCLFAAACVVRAAAPVPRSPDGHPDLQGIWTNVTLTPMERLADFKSLEISEAEASAYEKKEKARTIDGDVNSTLLQQAGSAGTGAYNDLFLD